MKTIIVAGITRSGLTLTMQMLNAGGYPCMGNYPAFEDVELTAKLFKENTGKAIKVVDTHMQFPPTGEYHVIRLRRNWGEQAKSLCKFLRAINVDVPTNKTNIKKFTKSFPADYEKIDSWAKRQKGMIIIDFEELILNPRESAEKISQFTGEQLDIDKMVAVVEPRTTGCYPTMLELKFIDSLKK